MIRSMRSLLPVTAMALVIGLAAASAVTLAGPPAGAQPIYPLARKAGFNTLTAAVEAAGLQGTLAGKGPFTVFAPTDEAFAKLPEATLQALLADKEALTNVLLYHVVAGEVKAADVVTLTEATMANGDKLTIDASNGVVLNGTSTVTRTDIAAKNGVIHVIDTVLIPPAK